MQGENPESRCQHCNLILPTDIRKDARFCDSTCQRNARRGPLGRSVDSCTFGFYFLLCNLQGFVYSGILGSCDILRATWPRFRPQPDKLAVRVHACPASTSPNPMKNKPKPKKPTKPKTKAVTPAESPATAATVGTAIAVGLALS